MTRSTIAARSDRSERSIFDERMLPDTAIVGSRPGAANALQLARRRRSPSFWREEGRRHRAPRSWSRDLSA